MKHIGLFEGIGGFSLAAKWMGWETKAWCEWNPFCQKVLKHHFPEAEGFGDITTVDFTKYANTIDILTGGFPCQPYSSAGKRLGKEDERHLFPEMLRAIREIQPRFVIGENVYGLVTWNGGLVFHEVQADLEAAGYEVQPIILPACAVNAPHRRDRVWFVAWNTNHSQQTTFTKVSGGQNAEPDGICNGTFTDTGLQRQTKRQQHSMGFEQLCEEWATSYADATGQRWDKREGESKGNIWEQFPTQSPICSGNDGLPDKLDGITVPKWRTESLKAFGNAIVPQVAYQLFRVIDLMVRGQKK